MPLLTAQRRDLNINLLRNKSQDDVAVHINNMLDDSNDAVVYRIGYSFAAYIPAIKAAILVAHTTKGEGKAKDTIRPFELVCA